MKHFEILLKINFKHYKIWRSQHKIHVLIRVQLQLVVFEHGSS